MIIAFNSNATKQKEILDDLADMKEIINKWKQCLHNEADPMSVASIKKAKKELINFNPKTFNYKTDMLLFNERYFEFIENEKKNKLGCLVLYECIGFEKFLAIESKLNNYYQLVRAQLDENTRFEIDYEMIGNGLFIFNNYYFLQDFSTIQELAVYDSNKNQILKKCNINNGLEILSVKTSSNKIAIECETNHSDMSDESDTTGSLVLILDLDLNPLCRKEVNASDLLSADEKYLYFGDQHIVLYDWSLNEIVSIKLQNEKLDSPFYIDITDFNWNIEQVQFRDGIYIFGINTTSQVNSFIFMFDETGIQINKIEIKRPGGLYKEFRIDSKNNIIIFESNESNKLKYHDLSGDLFKEITLKKNSKDMKKYNFSNFIIDLDDKLYFI